MSEDIRVETPNPDALDAVMRQLPMVAMLHSEAMAHNIAEAISREQSVARAPHERRLGYGARLTLAKAVMDEVCRSLGFPDSLDAALHPTDGQQRLSLAYHQRAVAAEAERDALREQVARVEAIHYRVDMGAGWCHACGWSNWPCPTIAAFHPTDGA